MSTDGQPADQNQPEETPEPVPITEQEVGEYREQDRFLPVRLYPTHTAHISNLTESPDR